MITRTETLAVIRRELHVKGAAAAAQATREAYESGRLDRLDLPEIFLALKAESSRFLEQLGGHPPGASRYTYGA